MEQKRVSYKVATALKEAGYPQIGEYWYDGSGLCCYSESDLDELQNHFYAAPYALEVWLWLWRKKGIKILPTGGIIVQGKGKLETNNLYNYPNDPEDAIISAIEYLVDNDLIK